MEQILCTSLLSKIDEQIERTVHLIGLLPAEQVKWKPAIPGAWPVGQVLGHLLECLAGFCAVLYAADPERLRHLGNLRHLPVTTSASRTKRANASPDTAFISTRDSHCSRTRT